MSERKKISVIIVEDDLEMLGLIKEMLQEEYSEHLEIFEAITYLEAIIAIAGHRDDTLIVISEFHFKEHQSTGIDVLNFAESILTISRAVLFAISAHDEDTVFADYSRTHHIQYFSESDLPKLKDAVGQAIAKLQ